MKTGCYAEPIQPNCAFFKAAEIVDSYTGKAQRCFFYEDQGQDSNPRSTHPWRVVFYYASHLAITKKFGTAGEKNRFLATLKGEATP
jgi:hypothetical protein